MLFILMLQLINRILDVCNGINEENWKRLFIDGVVRDSHELFRLTYYGGISHHLRKQVFTHI